MITFILDAISSLTATFIAVAGGWALSKRARRRLTAVFSRLAGLPIDHVYERQELASADLASDLAKARWIRVLAGRGNELTRDTFKSVWAGTARTQQMVQILLPDPRPGPNSWLARRETDVRRLDPGFSPGTLARQVRANVAYIAAAASRQGNVSMRFYNLPNQYRAIITDKVAYLTLYGGSAHGRHSPCIVARRPGLAYELAQSVFTLAWEHSRTHEESGMIGATGHVSSCRIEHP
jgi:hypothetical protein